MSKVIHLSDEAHNRAKGFCKQHGLKMSDWVADLIAEAIATGRTDPKVPPRVQAPAPAVVVVAPAQNTNQPSNKKKLERLDERAGEGETVPPWAAPPFWSKGRSS